MEGRFADSRGGDRRWNDRRGSASGDRSSMKIVADELYSPVRITGQSRRMSTGGPMSVVISPYSAREKRAP
jgi:hypothetical protein